MTPGTLNRLLRRRLAPCVALLLVTAPTAGLESSYRFHRQFAEDSSLISAVLHLTQDPQGFLWFTQNRTLHRYDGAKVLTVAALKVGVFTALASDPKGNLWLGTDISGLIFWDVASQRLETWQPEQSGSFFATGITSLAVDGAGFVWAASQGGRVAKIDSESRRAELFLASDLDPTDPRPVSVRTLLATRSGDLWIGTSEGKLFRATPDRVDFDRIDLGPEWDIAALAEGRDGGLWVGSASRKLGYLPPGAASLEPLVLESAGAITALAEDPQGHLWVGTETGVKLRQPGSERLETINTDPESPGAPSTDAVRTLYLDQSGVIWIASSDAGVTTTSTRASAFAQWQPRDSSPTAPVMAITETPDGSLWVGTYEDGLFRKTTAGEVRHYGRGKSDRLVIGDSSAMALLADHGNRLWIGTLRSGLSVLDLETESFKHYAPNLNDPTYLNNLTISTLSEAADGRILIGTFDGGLNVLDPEAEVFFAYQHEPDNPASLSESQVRSVLEDSSGRLWVGTRHFGLNLKLPDTSGFIRFRHDPDDPGSLAHDTVVATIEDRRGDIWLGTYSGLQRIVFDGDEISFETFGAEQGLAGQKIFSILEDQEGDLWLGTGQGISRFDLATQSFTNLARNHGLPPGGYNYNSAARGRDGRLYFGSNYGVTSFDPAEISLDTYTPRVVLTGALRLNRPIDLPASTSESGELRFSHRDSLLAFEFSLLDFTEPARNRFEHFLEGFDDDWIPAGSNQRATYSNLPPGRYTFRVRGANSEGVWSAEDASLAVRILPPPWATWWAYALYLLSALGIAFAYVRHQALKQRREARYTQRLEREVHRRTRELAEQNEKLRYANELLEVASVTDSLTGVRNRRFLLTTINQDIALVERALAAGGDEARQDSAFVFILFDLDGFKEINDSYGHSAGDLVLFQIRDLLNQACRSSDTLIRWGGDEFLIVAREATRAHVEALAERIRQSVADHLFDIGTSQPVQLTCSLGFACYPFVQSNARLYSWEEVIDIADRALYVAKRHGPNMWAGIFGTEQTEETPVEDLLVMIMERPELLGAEGSIRLVTSRPTPTQTELRSSTEKQRAS